MTTNHDDNATTWRDLAHELTPEQIARLEEWESNYLRDALSPAPWWYTGPRSNRKIGDLLLSFARSDARHNLDVAMIGVVATPAGAQHVEAWVDVTGDGDGWGRHVSGSRRATAGAEVVLAGWQDATAAVEWHAILFDADVELDATALRQLAAALIEAADEMDGLVSR